MRGINVGGNSKVEMKRLKEVFEKAGHGHVSTYINSGNVIFESSESAKDLMISLEKVIEKEFGFNIKIVVKSLKDTEAIGAKLPDSWKNDLDMKSDVMFLWEEVDNKKVLDDLVIKPELDNVIYVKGALLWMVKRKDITRSGMMRLAGSALYKQITIRNCNTFRKLLALMKALKN